MTLIYEAGLSEDHAQWIAAHMREPERRDCERTLGTVERALELAHESDLLMTVLRDDEPVATFGVLEGPPPTPWALLTESAPERPKEAYKAFRDWSRTLLDRYGHLENEVPADDEIAVALLDRLGFHVERGMPITRAGSSYYRFTAERGDL